MVTLLLVLQIGVTRAQACAPSWPPPSIYWDSGNRDRAYFRRSCSRVKASNGKCPAKIRDVRTQFTLDNPLTYQGTHVDINPEWAWFESRGAGLKIAVVDGGVQVSHPDFSFSQPIRVCDAFGDTVAAVHPHGGPGAAHGTAVAGIIFARHSNGQGIAGVAPEAQIIVTRIANDFGSFALDQYIADAIRCAWFTWGADILNNSWTGGPPDPNISGAIVAGSLLGRGGKGSLFVAGAGNDLETVGYPANIPQVVAVNAITRSGALASYAPPTGMTTTDLVAPSKGEPGGALGLSSAPVHPSARWSTGATAISISSYASFRAGKRSTIRFAS